MNSKKQHLIEELGVHFENVHQISPLAARIYALMVLASVEGHSFEEIVEITGASKSSVSTQLNLLLQLKKVDYFTKSGDRKRYFKSNSLYLRLTLEDYLKKTTEEIKTMGKITDFNAKYNTIKHTQSGPLMKLFLDYLLLHQKNLENTISQMEEIQNN